jgi:MOSC domain-containing protein
MSLYVAGLWRYPVKSLSGERVSTAVLAAGGIPGDRMVRVRGPEGVRTSRRHYRLIGLHGTLDRDGRARINGYAWDSAEALALVRAAAGADAWLEEWKGLERFDILPLLVATDGAIAAFGRDVRRLRPNVVIGGVEGLAERDWPGSQLCIGDAVIQLDSLRSRCHMTTIDPDTLQVNPDVLRDIVRRFGNKLALNADVARAGLIRVGDAVSLVSTATYPRPSSAASLDCTR